MLARYWPEEVLYGRRFVDVMSQLEDGRLMIDYGKFHDSISEEEATAEHLSRDDSPLEEDSVE